MKVSNGAVLDASALLALIHEEPGHQVVADAIETYAVMGTVNFSEVVSKLSDIGIPEASVRKVLENLGLEIINFDKSLAYITGFLLTETKRFGMSFADRACLATAQTLNLPCLTADRVWADLDLPGVEVKLIR